MRWISLWLSLACQSLLAAEWFPYPVQADGRMLDYRPLPAAAQPWRICALLPHGKDRYWWGVAWGLDQEAQRLGVRLGIYEAGGYEHGDVQLEQFDRCVAEGADAFVVASIVPMTQIPPQLAPVSSHPKPIPVPPDSMLHNWVISGKWVAACTNVARDCGD